MTAMGLEGLEHMVQVTHTWINDLDDRLGWNNKPRSYRLLKAVLHALRDWLQLNEAADLAAQLPTLLRAPTMSSGGPLRLLSPIVIRLILSRVWKTLSRLSRSHRRHRLSWPSSNCFRRKSAPVRLRMCATPFQKS